LLKNELILTAIPIMDNYKTLDEYLDAYDLNRETYNEVFFNEEGVNMTEFENKCFNGTLDVDTEKKFIYGMAINYECGSRFYMKFVLKTDFQKELTDENIASELIRESYGHPSPGIFTGESRDIIITSVESYIDLDDSGIAYDELGKYYILTVWIEC